MAYNYFPQNYQPVQYQQPQLQTQQMQIQNGGFVLVRSEDEARNYPVALGNSVTFKNESAPYIYTKTMGFSQMDRPSFDKYKLIKEDVSEASNSDQKTILNSETINSTLDDLKREIESIWSEIEELKSNAKPTPKQTTTKRDKTGDD